VADGIDKSTNGQLHASIRPWSSLLIRDYRLIFLAILCGSTSNHMRSVASLYQVYQLSGSSVQLGLAGFFQALPSIIFGLFGGVLADSFNRRRLIAVTHTLNIIPGLALGILTVTGTVEVWHVNALNVLAGALQVLGGPARQAIVPSLIPASHLLNAVTMTIVLSKAHS
jgi:MFS family permease